jgi:hypothetical protein
MLFYKKVPMGHIISTASLSVVPVSTDDLDKPQKRKSHKRQEDETISVRTPSIVPISTLVITQTINSIKEELYEE